jgi:para-nitrobenzyl esterase
MKKLYAEILSAIILSMIIAGFAQAADTLCTNPVATQQGLVRGKAETNPSVCAWKGIPYAAPPVGELRFRATQPAKPRDGVLNAYEFGPACPQKQSILAGGDIRSTSEDCLTLNIWRPQKPGKFPVMFWIHGGGFMNGAGSVDLYNGANLAELKDMVVVTINYRLGALGFLSLPELAQEDPKGSTGNYGILDQIQALEWVQKNIAAFGGDPDNVTIFGQSAGGGSVTMLLISPLAKGLFQRAIPMSGAMDTIGEKEKGYARGRDLAKDLGCKGNDLPACLRKKSPDAFVAKSSLGKIPSFSSMAMGFSPKVDGYVITCQPVDCFKQGRYNQAPVMLGHTRDEMKFFTIAAPYFKYLPKFAIDKLLKKMAGPSTRDLFKLYSYADYKHPSELFMAVITDLFVAPGFADAEALSQRTPTYLYRFDWDKTKYGAFHALDIPFVFGNIDPNSELTKKVQPKMDDPATTALAEHMKDYYANFAKTGDPNGPGLTTWPKYTVEKKQRIYFNDQITVAPISPKDLARYEFLNDLSRKQPAPAHSKGRSK